MGVLQSFQKNLSGRKLAKRTQEFIEHTDLIFRSVQFRTLHPRFHALTEIGKAMNGQPHRLYDASDLYNDLKREQYPIPENFTKYTE
jgi:hypothetical protein